MRRTVLLMLVGILIFAGCGGNGNTGILKLSNISFRADVSYLDGKYTADCIVDGKCRLTAEFLSPESLKGLMLTVGDDECSLSLDGIRIENADRLISRNSLLKTLYRIIKTNDGKRFSANKGACKITGDIGDSAYIITASPSGLPISLSISGSGFSIDFKKLTLVK